VTDRTPDESRRMNGAEIVLHNGASLVAAAG